MGIYPHRGMRDASAQRVERTGGSVPHPGLDVASSGKVSSPGPGSLSPAQPQTDSAQRSDWPKPEQQLGVERVKLRH